MKIRHWFFTGTLILALTGMTLTSCQKDKLVKGSYDYTTMTNLSEDELAVEEATNESMEDVEGLLSYQGGNFKSTERIPCNATVDSSEVVNDTITIYITYDGLSCNGRRYRTGQVEIRKRVGTHFGMEGASVNIRHINFTVSRPNGGRSMTFNSSKTFTKDTGGFVHMLGHNGFSSVVHRLQGRIGITFDNGTTRSWLVARQRTYTGTRGNLIMTVDGFGTSGEYNNLVTWGTNRNNEQFYTEINQSIVYKQSCGWDPVAGTKIHRIPEADKSAMVFFGYNSNFEPITGDECPTHYRVDWQNGTYTGTRLVPLP